MEIDDTTIYAHSPKRKRRAPAACTFCRSRKIKCNNEQPQCSNCKTYEKQCNYEQKKQRLPDYLSGRRSLQPRDGSGERRHELGGRIPLPLSPGADRETVVVGSNSPTTHPEVDGSVSSVTDRAPIDSLGQPDVQSTNPGPSGRYGVPGTYYGPTSAHFEDPSVLGTRRRPDIPPDLVEKVLMAEAAHQRCVLVLFLVLGFLSFSPNQAKKTSRLY